VRNGVFCFGGEIDQGDGVMAEREDIPIGIIYSRSGAYAAIGRAAHDGALLAIDEVNRDRALPFRFRAVARDPGGSSELYAAHVKDLLKFEGCRHIVGTITSSSRKEVLPHVERAGALLWYAFPYEGYETSDSVVYLGASANQHIVPILDYVLARFGRRPCLLGSNYIWGWEINRIAREIIVAEGGEPVFERHLPLGDEDVDHLIATIRDKRPDFVLSNLLGPSSYAFIHAYAELGRCDPDFAPDVRPIVSCNLTETDTDQIGIDAAGILTTSTYFETLATQPNRRFLAGLSSASGGRISQCFVTPYSAVHILAASIRRAGSSDPEIVRRVAAEAPFDTPYGEVRVDAGTGHSLLRPHLGKVAADGSIEIIHSTAVPIAPDPYLVRHAAATARRLAEGKSRPRGRQLRVVQ
jgi:ABC-type branched-subunit amino acid transport system substrate-binding protein